MKKNGYSLQNVYLLSKPLIDLNFCLDYRLINAEFIMQKIFLVTKMRVSNPGLSFFEADRRRSHASIARVKLILMAINTFLIFFHLFHWNLFLLLFYPILSRGRGGSSLFVIKKMNSMRLIFLWDMIKTLLDFVDTLSASCLLTMIRAYSCTLILINFIGSLKWILKIRIYKSVPVLIFGGHFRRWLKKTILLLKILSYYNFA